MLPSRGWTEEYQDKPCLVFLLQRSRGRSSLQAPFIVVPFRVLLQVRYEFDDIDSFRPSRQACSPPRTRMYELRESSGI